MKSQIKLTATLIGSAILLIACGGGGGGGTTTPPEPITMANCYKLTAGNTLNLTSTPSLSSYSRNGTIYSYVTTPTSRVLSNDIYSGQSTIKSRAANANTGQITDTHITATNTLYTRVAAISTLSGGTSTATVFSGYVRNLTVTPGQSQTYTYTSSTASSTTTTLATLTFVGVEDVTTPTGTYKNACKQTLVQTTVGFPSSVISDTFWYAEGYGNVKEIVAYNYTDGRSPASVTFTIQ